MQKSPDETTKIFNEFITKEIRGVLHRAEKEAAKNRETDVEKWACRMALMSSLAMSFLMTHLREICELKGITQAQAVAEFIDMLFQRLEKKAYSQHEC